MAEENSYMRYLRAQGFSELDWGPGKHLKYFDRETFDQLLEDAALDQRAEDLLREGEVEAEVHCLHIWRKVTVCDLCGEVEYRGGHPFQRIETVETGEAL